eukprot:492655_1
MRNHHHKHNSSMRSRDIHRIIQCIYHWKVETEGYLYRLMAYYMGYDEDEAPHKYFVQLLASRCGQNWMKMLWINLGQLHRIKHEKLRCLLCGCGEFFDRCGVTLLNARRVQQFEWQIKDESYVELCALAPRQCIKSPPFEYILNDAGDTVQFYLKCYKKHS